MDPAYHCAAVRAYFTGVTGLDKNTFEFHYVPKYPNGYFWVFPSEGDNANIGFGMLTEDITHQKIKLRDVLLEIIELNPKLKERFKNAKPLGDIKGWSIPFGYGNHAISGNRFMLVGDAASVADPLSGEGIGQAIVTGRIAAFQAKECFAKNDFSSQKLLEYDKAVDEKWGTKIRKRRYWSEVIAKHQWILDLAVKLLRSNNFISNLTKQFIMKLAT
jgi:flavin-dependent dehydrogenase